MLSDDELSDRRVRSVRGGVTSGDVVMAPPVCIAVIRRTFAPSSMASYPFRSGNGPHDIGTMDVFGRRGRCMSSLLFRRRRYRNRIAPAATRPTTAAEIAIPTTAPGERCFDDDIEVVVIVATDVVVNIGGRGRVGGILILEHEVKFDERQQNDVAFGELRPQ